MQISQQFDEFFDSLDSNYLPILESFNCTSTNAFSTIAIFKMMKQALKSGTLRHLRIGHRYDELNVIKPVEDCPSSANLEYLSLAAMQDKPDVLIGILRQYPNVREVDLSSTKVTGVEVRELIDREGGPLKWLGLENASKISFDAIEYARGKGTEVAYRLPGFLPTTERRSFRDIIHASGL